MIWNIGQSVFQSKILMCACNIQVWISTIWKKSAFENLAILKNEHIDNYLNYLYAFPTSYMWYFVSQIGFNQDFWA